jgi:hypothetical protein
MSESEMTMTFDRLYPITRELEEFFQARGLEVHEAVMTMVIYLANMSLHGEVEDQDDVIQNIKSLFELYTPELRALQRRAALRSGRREQTMNEDEH